MPDVPQFSTFETKDRMVYGCGMGCLCQVGALIIPAAIGVLFPLNPFTSVLFWCFGVTQWIGLIPLILNARSSDRPETAKGLIITGCVGLLLSSACGLMLLTTR